MPTPSIENTLLCLFSNDKCILIDDCNKKLVNVVPIASIWPKLSTYGMDSNLDAAYFCPEYTQVAFFKGKKCAIYNYNTKQWSQKAIRDFFNVPAGADEFYNGITAASTGVREENIALYIKHQFINGPIADPTVKPVVLSDGPTTLESNGWQSLKADQEVVASTLVCRISGSDAGDPKNPLRALFYKDTDGTYNVTFDDKHNPAPPLPGSFHLTQLWPDYDDNKYPINAATRVDPSILGNVIPIPGPGPVVPNTLCDELPNIMKSVCSLTVLMHKMIDACYPPSLWPTQPYPDGCSTSGQKHRHCGCKGGNKDCECKDKD